eukprot:TRINITY_DN38275_c0_g1_i1.p1 TRINITY_DN38275_c0_g1~~TRINITY_DN38275_c0_g1_i1.p1  ORF type:complete len:199 (+),score=31.77 TRINITY_DN38275_c0_g1_i1:51-647(+)
MQNGLGRETSSEEEPPQCCEMTAAHERSAGAADFDSSRGVYPSCIVWTWLPGCTQCTAGIVGHMGITNSSGEVWEFVGLGASKNDRELAFGPIMRYIPLSQRFVWRGTVDEGIQRAIDKYTHLGCHPLNNCHCFVAACLHEMRVLGFPFWNCFWWLLAVMVWVTGFFPPRWPAAMCLGTTIGVSGLVAALIFYTKNSG